MGFEMARLTIKSSFGFPFLIFAILVQGSSASGFPKSCSEIQFESGSIGNSSQLENSVIYPNGPDGKSLQVLCDFETDEGGWTVIQKRSSGPRDEFNRTWAEYSEGFGSLSGNFWLGLANIHTLMNIYGDQELRIELEDFEGNTAYAEYSNFSVSDASDFYRLNISGFSRDSTAGNSMTNPGSPNDIINGMRFTTKDKDKDLSTNNCAALRSGGGGGWWYNACSYSWLNGLYREKGETVPNWDGIIWYTWKGSGYSLAKTEIKIRTRKSQ